jgi:hypothetical protein
LQVFGGTFVNGLVQSYGNANSSAALEVRNLNGASGTEQYYINFGTNSTVIGRLFRGNGASGLSGNGLNIDNFEGFTIRANQLGGSGGTINLLGGETLLNTTTDAGDYKLQVSGNAYVTGTYTSAAPTDGTAAPWKLGSYVTTAPTADFSIDNSTSNCPNTEIQLNDESTDIPGTWTWTSSPSSGVFFNTSTSQNPTVTFANAGSGTPTIQSPSSIILDAQTEVKVLGSPFTLWSRTVSELVLISATVGAMAFCTDESGGAVPVFYDGSNWRRMTDRNIIS